MPVNRSTSSSRLGFMLFLLLLLLAMTPNCLRAEPLPADALGFFTNLNSRLLRADLGLTGSEIQIHPTNQYTPAVHRWLQVTANLWESTTDAPDNLPTAFQPLFRVTNQTVYLVGHTLVAHASQLDPLPIFDLSALTNPAAQLPPGKSFLCYQVPLILGARAGLPTFNEAATESLFQIQRKLQLRRDVAVGPITQTNQAFVLKFSAAWGVEFWNSSTNDFTRPVQLEVTNSITARLTNDLGINVTLYHRSGAQTVTNLWPRYRESQPMNGSFQVPILTSWAALPVIGYAPTQGFFNATNPASWDNSQELIAPRWGVTLSHRLHARLIDTTTGRLIDHVLLDAGNVHRLLTDEISLAPETSPNPYDLLWSTNALPTGKTSGRPGIIQQILVSLGAFGVPPAGDWQFYGVFNPPTSAAAITQFQSSFFNSTNLSIEVPYSPVAQTSHAVRWQANDPLVHQMPADLIESAPAADIVRIQPPQIILTSSQLQNLGALNERYRPWPAFIPGAELPDPFGFNPALRDPLARNASAWDFPTNTPLSLLNLGRIHRGSPWQTIYLKSAQADLATWQAWSGHAGSVAAQTHPSRDATLITLLHARLNTNSPPQLLSLNEPDFARWHQVLHGLEVWTNTGPTGITARPQFETQFIQSNSPQAALIATAIAAIRTHAPDTAFRCLIDILATPELTLASPWLQTTSSNVQFRGLTDRAYELLPAQLLSRLRADPIGALAINPPPATLRFSGLDGFTLTLESSTNFTQWLPIGTAVSTNGFALWPLPSLEYPAKFFRARYAK